jgi:hypothetical protein
MKFMFKKAERQQVKVKIAVTGVSGSGKTYSSLLIGRGLVGKDGKIAVIDTENRSASLYANVTDFDVLNIEAPFTVEKYTQAINGAVEAGYDVVVIDSLSHAWKQILADKEVMDARGGNSFANWGKMTPKHEAFLTALTHSKIHLIGTMRSKTEYVIEQKEGGKTAPRKVGTAPVQRDGMEYEFTVVFDISAPSHIAEASKDRTGLFLTTSDNKLFTPTIQTGEQIRAWLDSGTELRNEPAFEATEPKKEAPKTTEKAKGDIAKVKDAIAKATTIETLKSIEAGVKRRTWTDTETDEISKALILKEDAIKAQGAK